MLMEWCNDCQRYHGRGYCEASGSLQSDCSPSAGTWAGKCVVCGAEWSALPANDNGVCAKCGCHSVEQIIKRIPLRGNADFRHGAEPLPPRNGSPNL